MAGNGHCFVEWKEQFVSQERGNRVVHYFLKDSAGESVLAVVGTERSVRHMFYVVAEEFVRVYGAENAIHAGFKWRSRREVVDWLTSMLSKQHLHGDWTKSPKHDLAHAFGSPKYAVNGFGSQQMQGRVSRNWNGLNSTIVWSGNAWRCGKQLKHYPAFCRNSTTIAVQSFVFVMAKGENHYVAYLEDMYEDKRGQKKVKVRWFHHNQEVKGAVPLRNAHPKEVFITPYSQVISAECVDGPATVLTREHYEECLATFPDALATRVHLCFRQFRSNKVKPFDLTKLGGYFNQPILSCLNSKSLLGANSVGFGLYGEEGEEFSPSANVRVGAKRSRKNRGGVTYVTDHLRAGISDGQMNFEPSYINSRYGLSGKRLLPLKHVDSQQWYGPSFKVDEKIELLCQDSGLRGCWFRCTIVQVSRKQIKVQYDDVQDEDEYGNLEEWIPAFKLAVPDKLGMRRAGRPTIRPVPPPNEQEDIVIEVGSAVDAWWSDGWWEGVVTRISSSDEILQVYFPGEDNFLNMHKKDLRISREWVGDEWIDIQAQPGILPAISATITADTKVSMSSTIAKDVSASDVALSSFENPTTSQPLNSEEKKPDLALVSSSDSFPEEMEVDYCRKPSSSSEKANCDGGSEINVCQDRVDEVQGNDDTEGEGEGEDGGGVEGGGIEGERGDEGECEAEGRGAGDDSSDKLESDNLDSEILEASEKNCKAIELMEVTA
ncbi:hypothetical protein Tsubulata_022614 [Turnera subulata]|uniref:BAH domain-containing protein n=1 Tax=Turnera subulata TaxID=218843 RepID=A0A9Q0FDF0_9ROSI|nr:hypothetical protein Tsubulata_022614 [Turnera subulata]